MTTDYAKLAEPFPAEDIEWRVQSSGKKKSDKVWARVLAYVTNRAIQSRLDDVVGPDNWQNVYTSGPGGGVLCGISIRVERTDGAEWVTKWDGSENTDIEAVKGGLSGAMKRAAVHWGIGRYLYNLPAGWAQIVADKSQALHSDKLKEGKEWFHWNPPALPPWALPAGAASARTAPRGASSEPQEEPASASSKANDLKKLTATAKAKGVPPTVVTKLAEERFGRIPRELLPHQFDALIDRLEFGEWLPDDIDQTMNTTGEHAA